MLTEERQMLILKKLEEESVLYVNDLVTYLNTSESTIRRDLNTLDASGLLNKVHGGATSIKKRSIKTTEEKVQHRQALNIEEKIKISKYAASLIKPNDMVYLDAGTTTEQMIDFITQKEAVFVTNGIVHAKKLIENGFKTYILGGELKLITEAIVGVEAINSLRKYNFTKGYFGTNGVHKERGYTTPDISEAMVKEEALKRSKEAYILCDNSKFDEINSITFGDIKSATIITNLLENKSYREFTKIKEVMK